MGKGLRGRRNGRIRRSCLDCQEEEGAMPRISIFCIFLAILVLCLPEWAHSGTGLPKAPNWRFGAEMPQMDKGPSQYIEHEGRFNEVTESQKIINSWGYKARPFEEIKGLLPKPFYYMLSHPELYGDFRINETEYLPPRGPYWKLFCEATEKHKGTCHLDENNWLHNHKAGLPFPDVDTENDPKAGVKIVWNFLKRFAHDDRYGPFTSNLLDTRGNMRVLYPDNINFRFTGRLDLDPKPLYEPNPKNIDFIYAMPFMRPYGMRGTIVVIHRHQHFKPDDMWMYLPSMRRVRRMATTQTQDKLPGGMDVTWDTADGFMGFMPYFDIKYLGKKEILHPIVASIMPQMDLKGQAGVDSYFQRRNVYVVRAKYKTPITMKEFTLFIDPEMYYSCYNIDIDLKGRDWIFCTYFWGRDKYWRIAQSVMSFADIQRRHITRVGLCQYKLNLGYTPYDFSMEQLIKKYGTR